MSPEIPSQCVPHLQTQRLVLRGLNMHDADAIFAYASDPEVARYTFWHPHTTLDESRQFITWLTSPGIASWAIVLRHAERVIGTCFLHSFSPHHQRAEVAFNIAKSCWGQGYATEAARAVIGAGFAQWHLNRIEGTCMLANTASARVLEKAGMRLEGILRRYVFAKGAFHDMKLYAILHDDVK